MCNKMFFFWDDKILSWEIAVIIMLSKMLKLFEYGINANNIYIYFYRNVSGTNINFGINFHRDKISCTSCGFWRFSLSSKRKRLRLLKYGTREQPSKLTIYISMTTYGKCIVSNLNDLVMYLCVINYVRKYTNCGSRTYFLFMALLKLQIFSVLKKGYTSVLSETASS